MKKGYTFTNGYISYTVLAFAQTKYGNIALLERKNKFCPYVVARLLKRLHTGSYIWAQGHYFTTLSCATDYFYTRKNELRLNR